MEHAGVDGAQRKATMQLLLVATSVHLRLVHFLPWSRDQPRFCRGCFFRDQLISFRPSAVHFAETPPPPSLDSVDRNKPDFHDLVAHCHQQVHCRIQPSTGNEPNLTLSMWTSVHAWPIWTHYVLRSPLARPNASPMLSSVSCAFRDFPCGSALRC